MKYRYRKVSTHIWNDAKFRELSDRAKLVFLFLLTHPQMTSLGAMRATLQGLSAELGWDDAVFCEAFDEVTKRRMAEVDPTAHLVTLPNFIKHNQPENPNVVASYLKVVELLPECPLRGKHLKRVRDTLPKKYAEGFLKRMPIPEPEQEPEPKPDPEPPISIPRRPATEGSGRGGRRPVDVAKVLQSVGSIGVFASNDVEELVGRACAVTREKPEWWRDTIAKLAEAGGQVDEFERAVKYVEDSMDPVIRQAKDMGKLEKPGGYLFGKLTHLCTLAGVRWKKCPR